MTRLKKFGCLAASVGLYGAAAALFIALARRTHNDADAEIVGWCVFVSLCLAAAATWLAAVGLK